MSKTFYANKLEELDEIAKAFLAIFGNQKKVVFFGEMGVGKTTLIKSICKALNVQDIVSSPTFSVVNEYHDMHGNFLYHFDFYRIKNKEELFDLGLEEYRKVPIGELSGGLRRRILIGIGGVEGAV